MCVTSPFLPPGSTFYFSLLFSNSTRLKGKIIFFFFSPPQDPGDAAQQEAKQRYEPELELSGRVTSEIEFVSFT